MLSWHTIPETPPLEPESLDPRKDGAITTSDMPLFYQIINSNKYQWLLHRFQSLPALLGNWQSSYYETDTLLIDRDYRKLYPQSKPVDNYMCKVVRLLFIDEIDNALWSVGKDADEFFMERPPLKTIKDCDPFVPYYMDEKYIVYGKDKKHIYPLSRGTPGGKDPVLGTGLNPKFQWGIEVGNLMRCCAEPVGKTRGCWHALVPDNAFGDIRTYKLWYNGNKSVLKCLAEDEPVDEIIRTKYVVGTAFKDKQYYQKLHQDIQALLATLSNLLVPVYERFKDSLDEKIDNPNTVLYNPYEQMDRATLDQLKRLVTLVDVFNRSQIPCSHPPRIDEEWRDAINYRVFGSHLGPLYFREDTRNFLKLPNGQRIPLLRPNDLNADRVSQLRNEVGDATINPVLNVLENAIRDLPNTQDAEEFINVYALLPKNLQEKVTGSVEDINVYLRTNDANRATLIQTQRSVNAFFKKTQQQVPAAPAQLVNPKPVFDLQQARGALAFYDALQLPPQRVLDTLPGVKDMDAVAFSSQVTEPYNMRLNFIADYPLVSNKYAKTFETFKVQYEKWTKMGGQLLNMPFQNEFVDEFRSQVENVAFRMIQTANTLAAENVDIQQEIAEIERDAVKRAQNDLLIFLKQNYIEPFSIGLTAQIRTMAGKANAPAIFYRVLGMFDSYPFTLGLLKEEGWQLLIDILSDPTKNYDARIAEIEENLKTKPLTPEDKMIILTPAAREEALRAHPKQAIPSGNDLITKSNLRFSNNSCPFDTMFPVLFKIPGTWFEGIIRNAQVVYTETPDECKREDIPNHPGWKRVDELHEKILSDIVFVQSPETAPRKECATRAFWSNCFIVDKNAPGGADDPRSMTMSLASFYGVSDLVQFETFEHDDPFPDVLALPGMELIVFAIQDDTSFIGKQAYNVKLTLRNGEYTLLGVYSYSVGGIGHYDAIVRDPRSEKWYNFDGSGNVNTVIQTGGIPLAATKGYQYKEVPGGKGPVGWAYVRTDSLQRIVNARGAPETLPLVTPAPAPPPPNSPPPPPTPAAPTTPSNPPKEEPSVDDTPPVKLTPLPSKQTTTKPTPEDDDDDILARELEEWGDPLPGEFPITNVGLKSLYQKAVVAEQIGDRSLNFYIVFDFNNKTENTAVANWFKMLSSGLFFESIAQYHGNNVYGKVSIPESIIVLKDNLYTLRSILFGIQQLKLLATKETGKDEWNAIISDMRIYMLLNRQFVPRTKTKAAAATTNVRGLSNVFDTIITKTRQGEEAHPSSRLESLSSDDWDD